MSYTFSPNLLRRGTKCCKRHAVVFLGGEGTRTAVGGLRSAGAQFTELVSVSSGTRLTGLASVRPDLPFPADRTYRQKRSGSPPFILIHAPALHSAVAVTAATNVSPSSPVSQTSIPSTCLQLWRLSITVLSPDPTSTPASRRSRLLCPPCNSSRSPPCQSAAAIPRHQTPPPAAATHTHHPLPHTPDT